jgi:hypothetical protein
LLQLWHCAAALEDQVLKLSPPRVKLVPRNYFGRDRSAFIDFVSQVFVEAQGLLKLALRL